MRYGTTVLIIDDEEDICDLISGVLRDEGFLCLSANDSDEALEKISKFAPNLILLDTWLQNGDLDGLGILEIVKKTYPNIPIIMISGNGTIEIAVKAIKMGAYDYIEKPFVSHKLVMAVKRAAEAIILKKENIALKKRITKRVSFIGSSPAIVDLRTIIEKRSDTWSEVLVTGEFGSGKELLAKTIHGRANIYSPFVTIHSSELLQEKKPHIEINNRIRHFEMLNTGTLFIREIESLPHYMQYEILNLVKDKTSRHVRVIGSSSVDLKKEMKNGNLLQELYHRLSVVLSYNSTITG